MCMMGGLKFFLGLQIKQEKDGIYIHQTKYVKQLLRKYNLRDCKIMSTPMHPTFILSLDESNKKIYQTTYRGMIGFLLYLTASRPNIMFSVYLCACFQFDPRESHLITIKHNFRYLKGTTNLDVCYKKSYQYKLKGYNDDNFVGDRIERKITSERCHFIGVNLVSWSSKRQDYIQKGILDLKFINTKNQLADIFTKPFLQDKLIHIRNLFDMTFIKK
ncbi:putative mitochondrial protein, partial [Mucuna pruriens]